MTLRNYGKGRKRLKMKLQDKKENISNFKTRVPKPVSSPTSC